MQAWWFICDMDCLSVSSSQWMFICLIRCCFPEEPLILSVPGNNYMFPRGSPNIQGIKHHLACKSFSLFLTLCLGFYFPFLLLSLFPLCFWTAQTFNLIGFPLISPQLVPFIHYPTCSPLRTSYWSFFFFGNHFCAHR